MEELLPKPLGEDLESWSVLLPFIPSGGHSSIFFLTQIKRGAGLSRYKLLNTADLDSGPQAKAREVALGDAEVTPWREGKGLQAPLQSRRLL